MAWSRLKSKVDRLVVALNCRIDTCHLRKIYNNQKILSGKIYLIRCQLLLDLDLGM